jgi:hypothetical protein
MQSWRPTGIGWRDLLGERKTRTHAALNKKRQTALQPISVPLLEAIQRAAPKLSIVVSRNLVMPKRPQRFVQHKSR